MKQALIFIISAILVLNVACTQTASTKQQIEKAETNMEEKSNNKEIKATVQKFYDALSNPAKTTQEDLDKFMVKDWKSTPTPAGGEGSEGLLKSLKFFAGLIPDLNWEVKEMLVDGNRVTVRSVATGTPKGDFFGVPTDGSKKFEIMTIDIHTVENGKMTIGYHVEDWAGAIRQLTTK